MEKLAKQQKATGSEIERAIDNYIKDGPSRRHLQYCKERIHQLDELWNTFEDTDNEIRTNHSKDLGHPYYANGYYEAMQNIYQAHRSKIQMHIASLTTSNQEGEKSEKKLPEENTNAEQISMETRQPITKQADPVNDMGEGDVQARVVHRNPKDEISKLIRIQESVIESLRRLLKGIEISLQDSSKYFCEVKMKTVNHYWSRIETLHHNIWEITGEPLKAGYNIEEYFQLEEQVQDMLITLSRELDKYHPQPSRVMSSISPTVKLPKITLPKFDGDYLKWRQFYDLFSQMVHEQPMGDCQKMWYLKMNLCGEAEKLVRHLSLSEENYTAAWKMLQDRYNNTRLLVTSLLNKMLSQPTLTTESVSGIKSLHDTTQECLFGLDNLSVDTTSWDPLLLHLLIKKLDRTTHGLYEHTLSQPKKLQSTNEFLRFLENRFQSLEALGNKAKGLDEQHRRSVVAKSLSSIAIPMSTCACCKGDHKLFACQKFLQLTPTNRLNLVKKASMCINCLKTGHLVSRCISRGCLKCARKHNTLLHIENISSNRANSIQQVSSSIQQTSSMNQKHPEDHLKHLSAYADHSSALPARSTQLQRGYVLLGTVVIKLVNNEGSSVECRALLDSGSQLNFITERLAKKLGLAQVPELMDIMGIGQGKQQAQKRINISIESRVNGFNTRLEAFVLPEITSYQPTRTLNTATWPIPSNIQLADPHFNRPGRIDFLIGGEVYFQLLSVGQIKLGGHLPTLQNSVLGWIVGGKINDISQPNATCGICSEDEGFDQQVEKFWKLEELQSSETRFTTAEKYCENHFDQTTTRNTDGRFIVKLPFKGDPSKLGESKDLALQRFSALERKFAKHQDIKLQYIDFLSEYIRLGHMQEIDIKTIEKPYYFLPHHCVVKPESSTTKLRVVFDASAKTSSNLSLNDILCTGPKIQDDLFSVLLRFRFPRYVFTADIEKMYRQILVHNNDQKYQLVLWRSDPAQRLKCYKLNTVTYGTTSAPYLAIKCLQRLAKEESEKYPLATEMLKSNFYVDDVMAGSNSLTTAVEAQTQLNSVLRMAGFKLRKWCANHPRLIQGLPKEDIELELDFNDGTEDHIKTLGLTWLPKTDSFSIKTSWNNTSKVTKRRAYSDIAHLFDPLGFMAPVVVVAKMFLQRLWALKIDWDAALPQELHTEWIRFCEDLKSLENIKFPRHVFSHTSSSSMQIHAFADASEKAYGAAVYIRSVSKDNIISVRLLCAKSRVAPLKQTTLPRLELCAAKLAAELTDRIKTDLDLRDKPTFLWTDSEIVLNWLSSPSASFHTFVANRVSAIQELTTIQQWGHVSSRENPADVLSRGISPGRLETCNIWFYGPLFLHSAESTWPMSHTIDTNNIDQRLERRGIKLSLVATEESVNFIDTIDHKNSFKKLQRIVAYMLRFITKMKIRYLQSSRFNPTVLTTFELQEALIIIVKQMQQYEFKEDSTQLLRYGEVSKNSSLNSLAPFIDERGIIRVGGRLQASTLSYDAKHPILLPYSHPFTKLIMTDLHMDNLHCGPQTLLAATRQRFWPMKGKTIARSVVQRCVRCARAKPRLMTQLMGNLPATRVQPARPFMNAGVDFCGPIWTHLKIRGKRPLKSYIAVFCCFATKATHLELVTDLSAYAFIGAIKRFIARRGHCKNLYCDNATNFIGAKNQLSELNTVIHSHNSKELIMNTCSAKGIDFHFIPPRAPHFGGLWEAAVKSAKHLLHRAMGSASLTYEELETVIIEIEAILNSRPLTQMSSNPNDLTALTPGHFLVGEPLTNPVNPEAQSMKIDMLTRWKLLAHIKNEFWQRWSREYLNELQQRQKWKGKSENVKPGTMVIIKEDNVPVMKWPLGRIIKTHTGEDGLVRVADVRTATNVFRRPIHKLSPLPIEEETQEKGNSANPEVERTNLRYNEVGQSTSTNAEEVRQEKDASPKNKRKCSPISTITTLLLTCMILPTIRSSPVEITPFNSQPGIYFENLGAANIIANEWHLVVYYDLRPYWAEYETLRNGTAILKSMCKLLIDKGPCSRIISQFQHVFEELTDSNELLQSGASRNKRGALNIVGNVANALFGVLDSEYAEKMSQTIEKINQNEGHLLQLLRNQTSIIDSTVNIIRKNQEMNNKHFQELEAHVSQTANRLNNITEELYQEKIAQLFASLSIQLMLINTNFQRAQSSILDVITNTHQGRVSAELLSPQQLRHEVITIKTHLASSLRLPISQDNIANLYNLLTIEGRTVAHHVIFRLKLPLLAAGDFELFRIIPIPVLINETFVAIKPSSHFLVINLHRDQYYPLTEQELYSCVITEEANHMCKQRHPIYRKGANISTCEIEFINHKPQSPSCRIMTIEGKQQWIQLYNPNQWIYAVKEKTIINIVCGTNVTQATLVGSGILTLQGHCTIKQEFITIQGHNTYPTNSRTSFTPSGNLTDFIDPEKITPLSQKTYILQSNLEELEALQRKITLQQLHELPYRIQPHDIHQYTIGYIGLLCILVIVSYLIWRHRANLWENYKTKPTPLPRKNRRESFTVEVHLDE